MTTLKEIWRLNAIPMHINMPGSGMMSMQYEHIWCAHACVIVNLSKQGSKNHFHSSKISCKSYEIKKDPNSRKYIEKDKLQTNEQKSR